MKVTKVMMNLIVIKEEVKRPTNIRKKSQGVNTERATNTKKRRKGKRAEKDMRQLQNLSDVLLGLCNLNVHVYRY